MFFIITVFAAIAVTIAWYTQAPKDPYRISTLCFIFWGASLMWLVDHIVAYIEEGGPFFEVSLDATLLGICTVLFGFVIWLIILLLKDPKGIFQKSTH